MELNEAYEIMELKEDANLRDLGKSYLNFIRNFDPNKDSVRGIRVDEAYKTLRTHLTPANESTRDNHLTFKLGDFLPRAI